MPIYEYYCSECGHEFELMQKITDRPVRKCKKCGRMKAKRMISQTAFVLKGTGWYVTDYSGKKANPVKSRSEASDGSSETSSDSSDSSKTSSTKAQGDKKAANA